QTGRGGDASPGGDGAGGGNARPGGEGGDAPGGHHEDTGHLASHGATRALPRGGFVAPVDVPRTPGAGAVPLETELVDATGAQAQRPVDAQLRGAAPGALGGLDRTVVPRSYREQVRAYFGER